MRKKDTFLGSEQLSLDNMRDYMTECFALSLKICSRIVTKIYDNDMFAVGLRSTQFSLLMAIALNQTQTMKDLAQVMGMDRTTLTRNLKPLEKSDLVVKTTAQDKRAKSYLLTDKGWQVLMQALPFWENIQNKMKVIFAKEFKLEDLSLMLRQIAEKADRQFGCS